MLASERVAAAAEEGKRMCHAKDKRSKKFMVTAVWMKLSVNGLEAMATALRIRFLYVFFMKGAWEDLYAENLTCIYGYIMIIR